VIESFRLPCYQLCPRTILQLHIL